MEVSFHPSKLGSTSGFLVDINTVKLLMTLGLIAKSRCKSNHLQLLFLRNEMHIMFFPSAYSPDGPPMLTPPSLLSCVHKQLDLSSVFVLWRSGCFIGAPSARYCMGFVDCLGPQLGSSKC